MGPVCKMKKIFILFLNIFFFYNLSFSQEWDEIFDLACITDTFTTFKNGSTEASSSGELDSFRVALSESNNFLAIHGCGICNALGTYNENARTYYGECKSEEHNIGSNIRIDRVTGSFTCKTTVFIPGTKDIFSFFVAQGSCEKAKNKF